MASGQHNLAASATFNAAPLARLFQQPAYTRWLILAGLGTTSLLVATRFAPFLFPFFGSSSSTSSRSDQARSDPTRRPTSPPNQSTSTRNKKKDRFGDDFDPVVAIFWDVDNCAPPTGSSGRSVALAIRSSLQNLELGPIVSFKAYLELSSETQAPNAAQVRLRSELQGCGVSLIDTPKSGRKDVADKMMITDLLAFAIDQPAPATIVLISGDRDFAYPLGLLRNRGYQVVLIVPPIGAVPILEASANVVMSWRQEVLGIEHNQHGKPYSNYSHSNHQQAPITPSKSAPSGSTQHQTPSSISAGKPPGALARQDRRPSDRTISVFQPLISILEQYKREGNNKPLRSAVASRLVSVDSGVFVRAGASRWAEYAAVAEAAGIVLLGTAGEVGTEWVMLKDNQKRATNTPSKAHALPSSRPWSTPSSSSTPNRNTPASHTSSVFKSSSSTTDAEGVPNPRAFLPLIDICKEQRALGNQRPLSALVGTQLTIKARSGGVDAYAMAGVSNWREYITLADKVGIARSVSTGFDGVYVVEVHPKYLNMSSKELKTALDHMAQPLKSTKNTGAISSSDATPAIGYGSPAKVSDKSKKASTVVNGHDVPQVFAPLVELLLQQQSEGRSFSTDYFCHSVLGSHRSTNTVNSNGVGIQLQSAQDFKHFLESAVAAKIITTEPGLKPDVRHIRLHPRLVRRGTATTKTKKYLTDEESWEDEDDDEDEVQGKANKRTLLQNTRQKMDSIGASSSEKRDQGEKEREMEQLRKETQQVLASLTRSGSSEGHQTASGPVSSDDSLRFRPLLDTITSIRKDNHKSGAAGSDSDRLSRISKTKLSNELRKRNPGPAGIGAFYQSLGSTGFTDYLTQAKDKALVVVRDDNGGVIPRGTTLMGLSDYTVDLA